MGNHNIKNSRTKKKIINTSQFCLGRRKGRSILFKTSRHHSDIAIFSKTLRKATTIYTVLGECRNCRHHDTRTMVDWCFLIIHSHLYTRNNSRVRKTNDNKWIVSQHKAIDTTKQNFHINSKQTRCSATFRPKKSNINIEKAKGCRKWQQQQKYKFSKNAYCISTQRGEI